MLYLSVNVIVTVQNCPVFTICTQWSVEKDQFLGNYLANRKFV
jgi:hypothetical protein